MEPQTQQPTEDGGSNKEAGSSANRLCRQTSTRWNPTTDQIRIRKELYYKKGVRSLTVEQVRRISLQLKRYRKIESKNVFYWFGNHRAREKQKKKITSDVHMPMQRSGLFGNGNGTNWKPEDQYINFGSFASTSASSAGVIAFNGHMGNYGGYGSMNMEIETLPLFPMHSEDIFGNMKNTSEGGSGYSYYFGGWGSYNGGSRISLELSLNSYGSTLFSSEGVFSAREETNV